MTTFPNTPALHLLWGIVLLGVYAFVVLRWMREVRKGEADEQRN